MNFNYTFLIPAKYFQYIVCYSWPLKANYVSLYPCSILKQLPLPFARCKYQFRKYYIERNINSHVHDLATITIYTGNRYHRALNICTVWATGRMNFLGERRISWKGKELLAGCSGNNRASLYAWPLCYTTSHHISEGPTLQCFPN